MSRRTMWLSDDSVNKTVEIHETARANKLNKKFCFLMNETDQTVFCVLNRRLQSEAQVPGAFQSSKTEQKGRTLVLLEQRSINVLSLL